MTSTSIRAAMITGAAAPIGSAIARSLAADGWRVVLHEQGRHAQAAPLAAEIVAGGGTVCLVDGDLADRNALASLVDTAIGLAPSLSLLVNAAAFVWDDDALTAQPETLARSFAINTTAPIVLARRFAETMPAGRVGVVVNLLDSRVQTAQHSAFSYRVSTHALAGATRMLALALAPRVRVNAIAHAVALSNKDATDEAAPVGRAGGPALRDRDPLQQGPNPSIVDSRLEAITETVRLIEGSPAMTGSIITLAGD